MIAPPCPPDERERLLTLRGYRLLDSPAEPALDAAVRLAACLFDCPISAVSLVDSERQWFKAVMGLGTVRETPRRVSFCAHAILAPDDLLVVPDAEEDERFAENPLVTGAPGIRFYAGAPLVSPEGHALGSLCVIGPRPQEPGPASLAALADLRDLVVGHLNLRRVMKAHCALHA